MPNRREKVKELVYELQRLGINIRNDWSGFDGRDLLQALDIWLGKLSDIEGIIYEPYYNKDFSKYAFERFQNRHNIQVDKWFMD